MLTLAPGSVAALSNSSHVCTLDGSPGKIGFLYIDIWIFAVAMIVDPVFDSLSLD